ncbi:unnamed protein product [Polarella glacialis]|uniref:Uncharacterized protein n=1 Tax=Polarella glacialis TaxID=89957 RepID=A0A813HRV6_POLGL|nr:unnamed protein product [Polarella glacialis]
MMKLLSDSSRNPSKSKRGGGSDNELELDADDMETKMLQKGMSAIRNLDRLKDRLEAQPRRIVKDFMTDVRHELGAAPGDGVNLRNWSRRLSFGKFRGLRRCMEMLISIQEKLESGQPRQGQALCIQCIKCLHQVILSNGEWETGWLLTTLQDPSERRPFAGSTTEMAVVSGYLASMAELKKKVHASHNLNKKPPADSSEDDETGGVNEAGGADGAGAKKKKKKKKKEWTAKAVE